MGLRPTQSSAMMKVAQVLVGSLYMLHDHQHQAIGFVRGVGFQCFYLRIEISPIEGDAHAISAPLLDLIEVAPVGVGWIVGFFVVNSWRI